MDVKENKRERILKVQKNIDTFQFGNEYGGFNVSKKNLNDSSVVYSFGIGEDLSFSEALIKEFDCNIYAFDPTPKSIEYVKKHSLYTNHKFSFYSYGIADYDGLAQFHLPTNNDYVSGSMEEHRGVRKDSIEIDVKRLLSIMNDLGHKKIHLLKMDIEGSEFSVMKDILISNIDIEQICLEVHDRFFKDGIRRLEEMVICMNEANYSLINKNKDELTFLKNKL